MNKKASKILNISIPFVLIFVLTIMCIQAVTKKAEAATGLGMAGTTVRGYAYTEQNFPVYDRTDDKKRKIGTCYGASDYIIISKIMDNGWSYITYPAGNSTKSGYYWTEFILQNPDFSCDTGKVQSNITTYKKSNCNVKFGTSTTGDIVFITGYHNGNTQILYPCSGYYKTAWIKSTYKIVNGILTKNVQANNPEGYVDSITSDAANQITINGWAFDRDNLNTSLQIKVYIGGSAGSGVPSCTITANANRSDVNNAYPGVGNYHGFSANINTNKTGTQTVYVYALNIGNGSDSFLGSRSLSIQSNGTVSERPRSVGATGINLIKAYEKCRLTAYKAVSTEKYYTIGWGHYGADVTRGMVITQAQADNLFTKDIEKYEGYLNSFLDRYNVSISQPQYDALLSFTYNLGNQWVKTPSFQLKTILINGANRYTASEIRIAFTNWNKSAGKALQGLTNRRNAEADLFLSGM